MYSQLKPVAKTLTKLQNDNANIAGASELYLELLQDKEVNPHFSKMKSSFDKIMTPVHFFAHLMNPGSDYRMGIISYFLYKNCKNCTGKNVFLNILKLSNDILPTNTDLYVHIMYFNSSKMLKFLGRFRIRARTHIRPWAHS